MAKDDHANRLQEAVRLQNGSKVKAKEKYPPSWQKSPIVAGRRQLPPKTSTNAIPSSAKLAVRCPSKNQARCPPALKQCLARYDAALAEAEAAFEQRKEEARAERESDWKNFARHWSEGQDRLIDVFNLLKAAEEKQFLPWYAPFWQDFAPSENVPPASVSARSASI